MTTGIDQIMRSPAAQEFWLRRLIAVIIDYAIVFFPIYAIGAVAWAAPVWAFAPSLVAGALMVLMSALFEAELGYTIGKRIMGLEVVSLEMRPYDMERALVRNISKVHPAFLLIDLLLGLLMERRPNMRFLDTSTQCEVVDAEVAALRRREGWTPPPPGVELQRPPQSRGVTVEPASPTMPPEGPGAGAAPPPPPTAPEQPRRLPTVPVEVAPKTAPEGAGTRAPGMAPPTVPKAEAQPPTETKKGGEGWEEMGATAELPEK
jgi:uncharacterized RDD family membrane protein YckC